MISCVCFEMLSAKPSSALEKAIWKFDSRCTYPPAHLPYFTIDYTRRRDTDSDCDAEKIFIDAGNVIYMQSGLEAGSPAARLLSDGFA